MSSDQVANVLVFWGKKRMKNSKNSSENKIVFFAIIFHDGSPVSKCLLFMKRCHENWRLFALFSPKLHNQLTRCEMLKKAQRLSQVESKWKASRQLEWRFSEAALISERELEEEFLFCDSHSATSVYSYIFHLCACLSGQKSRAKETLLMIKQFFQRL